jgi:tetratricopeptide (TPR) repeat protein
MSIPSVFISYSHKDEIWKDRLRPHLRMLEQTGRLTIWDDRHIDAGATWYEEIKKAMQDAEVAVCLISADYLSSDFCIKEEIPYFLERRQKDGMLLLPILIRQCLWEEIDWLKRIQMLPRDGKAIATDFREDWDTPFKQVAKEIVSIPEKSTRELFISLKPKWLLPEKVDVDRLPVTGAELFGRQNELKSLDEAWESDKINVISLVAWGGVGKSTLINKWREQLALDNYRSARRVFAWSFYSQGTGDRVTSADTFIAEALTWFGDPEMANSNASAWDKGQRLADLVKSEKTLLLLDGMEPLQSYLEFERGKINDPALAVLVTELARENPGLCVITTRESVVDLAEFSETTHEINLEQISAEAGRALLRVGGVLGTDTELEQTARDFGLHALALNLLSTYLHEIPGHHISHAEEILDLGIPLERGKHPRRVMSAFAERFGDSPEVDLLRMLGLFNSPAEKEEVAAVRIAPLIPGLTEHLQAMSDVDWIQLVNRLRRTKLIANESAHRPDTLDAHPLVREHFGEQLKEVNPAAWREGNNRLYEYYKASAKELPNTIQEMSPLFAAVMHGCQAERYQSAWKTYYKRISRGESFAMDKLGAVGSILATLSGFFDSPWSTLVSGLQEIEQGYVLNNVGFCLGALGRISESIEPSKASYDMDIALEDWENATRSAINLSDLYMLIGDLNQALVWSQKSIEMADLSKDTNHRRGARTHLGDVQLQVGHFKDAEIAYRDALEIQRRKTPRVVFFSSGEEFDYHDFLLSQRKYQKVQQRAEQLLEQTNQELILINVARNNLSLGLAHMFQIKYNPNYHNKQSINFLNRAMDGLRRAGQQAYIVRGLFARTEFYRITGVLDKAQKDLDEAFSIATRGGMGLCLADCHLEYGRLKIQKSKVEGQKVDVDYLGEARGHLKTAKEMIEKMGYHRRDKEVEELEKELGVN